MEQAFSIGHLAREAETKVQTIRYYEEIGLIPAPDRTAGNQRRYRQDHLTRLRFVRHARSLGFSLDAIRELLTLSAAPDQSCAAADDIARRHLAQVERRIAQLSALKAELEHMVEQCKGGEIASCRVIEVLGDHTHCLNEHHETGA